MAEERKGKIVLTGDLSERPEWEGIIDNLDVDSLPIRFIVELTLNLNTKERVIIDVPKILAQSHTYQQASQRVNNIIREHNQLISTIDFKVNVDGLKSDVSKATSAFTKKVNKTIKRKNAEEKQKKWNRKKKDGGDQS